MQEPNETTPSFDGTKKVFVISYLSPRDVERKYPALSRSYLANRRKHGLPPRYKIVGNCVRYSLWDIEQFAKRCAPTGTGLSPIPQAARCAIYIRGASLFSSDNLGELLESCKAHQNQNGWQHATTTVDFGPSNQPWRPLGGFQEVLERAQRQEFDVLLVPSSDHISEQRRGVRHFLTSLARFGVHVRALDTKDLTINPNVKE